MKASSVFIGITITGLFGLLFFIGNSFARQQINKAQIQRGKYLVSIGGCHDCHSPKVFTSKGPEPDPTRLLSGHTADTQLPQIPQGVIGPDKWGGLFSNT